MRRREPSAKRFGRLQPQPATFSRNPTHRLSAGGRLASASGTTMFKMQREAISRRSLLKAATATAILQGINVRSETHRSDTPNVVVILADDLGYGDLSSYGAIDLKTPNIDALVSGGMRFNNFYANSPVCSPTRASILSGMYPDLAEDECSNRPSCRREIHERNQSRAQWGCWAIPIRDSTCR